MSRGAAGRQTNGGSEWLRLLLVPAALFAAGCGAEVSCTGANGRPLDTKFLVLYHS